MKWRCQIPDNIAAGTDECLQRCGLSRPSPQPTKQLQPKVSGHSMPPFAGSSTPTTTATPTSSSTSAKVAVAVTPSASSTTKTATTRTTTSAASQTPTGSAKGAADLSATANDASSSSNNTGTSPILIALVIINALLVVGLLVALFLYVQNRSRQSAFDNHRYAPPATPADPILKYVCSGIFTISSGH
jgi:cobalamin biosynthesis Mg chelatase CobN